MWNLYNDTRLLQQECPRHKEQRKLVWDMHKRVLAIYIRHKMRHWVLNATEHYSDDIVIQGLTVLVENQEMIIYNVCTHAEHLMSPIGFPTGNF